MPQGSGAPILPLVVVRTSHLRLLADQQSLGDSTLIESYRRLADVFHEVLAEQTLDALLVRVADTVGELIPHDTLTIYEADEANGTLKPVLVVRDRYADEIMSSSISFTEGEGITGWAVSHREAVLANQAHLDPRVRLVPGTPIEPESLICVPLTARGHVKGALNIYRDGEGVDFTATEFELAKRFGDAAALALDNAEIRARLEHQARTDSLTGLFNHSVFYEQLLHALQESSRLHSPVAVLMLDIDDFKHVNDVHGHAVGDELLRFLAEVLRACVRPEDVICRLGGEEFAVVMVGCTDDNAIKVAERIKQRLAETEFPGIGRLAVSVGLALGPEHAMNPRELAACAEVAMMTAKAQGKNQIVLYSDTETERPDTPAATRDVRSIAHLKMLQSLSGKLNRLNDVREMGEEIAAELRSLIDYHNCRIFVSDDRDLVPIAFRGELSTSTRSLSLDVLRIKIGVGITGRCAELGESIVVGDAANYEFGHQIEGTPAIEESLLAVPLRYGSQVVGVIVVSKLGLDQFDEDEVRLLEVLAGHAAVAIENARLYESARREAESATALLEFGRELATLVELDEIVERVTSLSAEILGSRHTSFWLEVDGKLRLRAQHGHTPEWAEILAHHEFPLDAISADREPYVIEPEEYAQLVDEAPAPGGRYALAPFSVVGRRAASLRSSSARTSRSASSASSAASPTRRSSRSPTPRATKGSSGRSSPRSRRSRTRSRRTTSTRHGTPAGSATSLSASAGRSASTSARSSGSSSARCSTTSARSASRASPLQARPPDGAGAEDRPDASGARRADHRADRPAPGRAADRPPLPRALGRRRLSGPDRRRGHPARVADHLRLRRVPRDDDRSPVSPPPQPSRGAAPAGRRGGHAVRPGVVEVALGVLEHVHERRAGRSAS